MKFSCKYCERQCVKKGVRKGIQKLYCSSCKRYQQSIYKNNAYRPDLDLWIMRYLKEGLGIRSISRLLKISTNTVISRIIKIAKSIPQPPNEINQSNIMWNKHIFLWNNL